MIRYKIDVLEKLKEKGYSTYKLTSESIFGAQTIQKFRKGIIVTSVPLDRLCKLLQCNVGDVLEYVEDEE